MKPTVKIKIGRTNYTLEFGYAVNRMLSEHYGLASYSDFGKYLQDLKLGETSDVTFDQLNFIRDLVWFAIIYGEDEEPQFKPDKIVDVLLQNPKLLVEIMKAFVDSYPKQEVKTVGKQQTRNRKN